MKTTEKLSDALIKQISSAEKEKGIAARTLIEEIKLLLPDYFLGSFQEEENGLEITFLNGQKFLLKAELCA